MLKGKLPSEVVNERHQYVNALKQFVEEQKKDLKQVLEQLGLTEESLSKVEPKQICPYDSNHFIPEKSFKQHAERCRLLKAGYQQDELPSQSANTDFCYEDKNSLKIMIDESLMNKIIWDDCVQKGDVYTGHRTLPVSHIEENTNLTQNDRLAIYRYVVSKSHEAGNVIEVDKTDELLTTDWGHLVKKGLLDAQNNEKYSSKLEQLAALRDMKRRRQSYRAKNVHITKKSYTEIIREVIVNQMEVLVPARSKSPVVESDNSEKYKTGHKDRRQKRDWNGDDDDRNSSSSRKHGSRGQDGDRKRYRYHSDDHEDSRGRDGGERDKMGSRSKSNRGSDFQPDSRSKSQENVDLELIKKESASGITQPNESLDKDVAGQFRERNEGRSRSSSPSRRPKRSRSRSYSSSPTSGEDHHHRHHKKSKHKKKSKHSKKHSKKHKR